MSVKAQNNEYEPRKQSTVQTATQIEQASCKHSSLPRTAATNPQQHPTQPCSYNPTTQTLASQKPTPSQHQGCSTKRHSVVGARSMGVAHLSSQGCAITLSCWSRHRVRWKNNNYIDEARQKNGPVNPIWEPNMSANIDNVVHQAILCIRQACIQCISARHNASVPDVHLSLRCGGVEACSPLQTCVQTHGST